MRKLLEHIRLADAKISVKGLVGPPNSVPATISRLFLSALGTYPFLRLEQRRLGTLIISRNRIF